jgi:ATP-dependent helicase HrpA
VQKWERFGLTTWSFGDLPERITIDDRGAKTLFAWPGLPLEDGAVCVRLFHSEHAARNASLAGIQRLVELAVERDLGWLEKDLRALAKFAPLYTHMGSIEELQTYALANAKKYALPDAPFPTLTRTHFDAAVEQARQCLQGLAPQLIERVRTILELREEARRRCVPAPPAPKQLKLSDLKTMPAKLPRAYPGMANDLDYLVPKHFLTVIPFAQLPHLPRYLKAMLVRADRAAVNPAKDAERARQLAPYQEALGKFQRAAVKSSEMTPAVETLRWMFEEFKVSLFAQELGTAYPVSPKRLDQQIEIIQGRRTL